MYESFKIPKDKLLLCSYFSTDFTTNTSSAQHVSFKYR